MVLLSITFENQRSIPPSRAYKHSDRVSSVLLDMALRAVVR